MHPKKILVFEAYPVFSGSQRVSLNICKILKANGFHITLLLADDSKSILRNKFGPFVDEIIFLKTNSKLTRYGSSDRWFKPLTFVNSFFTALLPFYISCIKVFRHNHFDCFYYCDLRGSVMMLFPTLFFKGKKICYLQGKNTLKPGLAKLIYLKFTNYLLCPSNDVLISLPPSPKKIVLNYGIDFSQYDNIDPARVETEIKEFLPANLQSRIRFLYAGLIRPEKGAHRLIEALNEIKNEIAEEDFPVLFLLGEPKTHAEIEFASKLVEYCKNNGLTGYVFWLGWKDNVLEWMKNVNYFIFPTIDKEENDFEGFDKVIQSSEGSPVVLLESSFCGLFSLASKVTGVKEIITDNQNGLMYNPNLKNELSNCIKKLLVEKPQFVDFPNRELFSKSTFSNKILELFSN